MCVVEPFLRLLNDCELVLTSDTFVVVAIREYLIIIEPILYLMEC